MSKHDRLHAGFIDDNTMVIVNLAEPHEDWKMRDLLLKIKDFDFHLIIDTNHPEYKARLAAMLKIVFNNTKYLTQSTLPETSNDIAKHVQFSKEKRCL